MSWCNASHMSHQWAHLEPSTGTALERHTSSPPSQLLFTVYDCLACKNGKYKCFIVTTHKIFYSLNMWNAKDKHQSEVVLVCQAKVLNPRGQLLWASYNHLATRDLGTRCWAGESRHRGSKLQWLGYTWTLGWIPILMGKECCQRWVVASSRWDLWMEAGCAFVGLSLGFGGFSCVQPSCWSLLWEFPCLDKASELLFPSLRVVSLLFQNSKASTLCFWCLFCCSPTFSTATSSFGCVLVDSLKWSCCVSWQCFVLRCWGGQGGLPG